MQYYVGTSGWYYKHWKEHFYPSELFNNKWLTYYSDRFSTVELNNSFYRLPPEMAITNWYNSTPSNFSFAVKVSRFITHTKRLRGVAESINKFISRIQLFGTKLGPLLYQLPPMLKRDDSLLKSFLHLLPNDIKHAIEFRHHSWFDDTIFATLGEHKIGFCIYDMPGITCPLIVTTDFAYVRFHGHTSLYNSNYSNEELRGWARRFVNLAEQIQEMYIYFNNDIEGFSVLNAMTLHQYLTS